MAIIGIDFGTTRCAVARWSGDQRQEPQLINLDEKSRVDKQVIKTIARLSNGVELRNFKLAADQSARGEVSIKRIINAVPQFKYDQMEQCLIPINNDPEYQLEVKRHPIPKSGGGVYQEHELVESLDFIFKDLYERSRQFAAAERVVVGLPLGYSELGRKRIINSLIRAKWAADKNAIILFPEPLAIALRCGLDYKQSGTQRVMVADHGGGTLDMCIFDLTAIEGDFHIKVLSQIRCDMAGNRFDEYLMEWVGERVPQLTRSYEVKRASEIEDYPLWDAIEESKISLSSKTTTTLKHPCRFGELKINISRSDLEAALKPGLDYIRTQITALLRQINDGKPVEKVFLAGGSSRMPCITKLFKECFSHAEVINDYSGNGTLAQSLALVPRYRDLIERLCENTYGIWDYKNKRIVVLVEAGTLITPKTNLIQAKRNQIIMEGEGQTAPLIVFDKQGGRWEPIYQIHIDKTGARSIDLIPGLDNESGVITVNLEAGGIPVKSQILNYNELINHAPPVVHMGQIARVDNGASNYFINYIRDIATGQEVDMAVGKMESYRLHLRQYRIDGERREKLEDNSRLSVLVMSQIDGAESVNVETLINNNSFQPVLNIEGHLFSIVAIDEVERAIAQYEVEAYRAEAATTLQPDITVSNHEIGDTKDALIQLVTEEIDRAYEKGKTVMKRELLQKYVEIKTAKSKINTTSLKNIIDEWDDSDLDNLIENAFRLSSSSDIYNLVTKELYKNKTRRNIMTGLSGLLRIHDD